MGFDENGGTLTVRYSKRFSLCLGEMSASESSSIPSTKIKVPTIMTGIKPMMTGPMTITVAVSAANMKPASLLLPPDRMTNRVFAYTR